MPAAPYRYDQVSYPTGAFEDTHPRRMATLAALYGCPSPDIETARILELGCGRGGNLIPMAYALPNASFVGIDLAKAEIAAAATAAAQFSLSNLSFHHLDICAVTEELGRFDYIIAHGVYSWIPPNVQERLLWICGNLLSERGVAYVSYNAMPGGLVRRMLRDMLLYDCRQEHEPGQRIERARSFSRFAAEAAAAQDPLLRSILIAERDRIAELSDAVLFHDDLSDCNEALYLHEFLGRAEAHGLRYVADATFHAMYGHHLPAVAQQALARIPDRIEAEQYLDFFTRRRFRRTLLCRAAVELAPVPQPAATAKMWAVSYCSVDSPKKAAGAPREIPELPQILEQIRDAQPVRFRNLSGVVVGLGDPLAKAALLCLSTVSPAALTFAELLVAARQRLEQAGVTPPPEAATGAEDPLAAELMELLITLYSGDMLELYANRPRIAATPGAEPRASFIARWQAQQGAQVVNLWHRNLIIDDPLGLAVLPLLDGTRDRAAILQALASPPDSSEARPPLVADAAALEVALTRMGQLGLLES